MMATFIIFGDYKVKSCAFIAMFRKINKVMYTP